MITEKDKNRFETVLADFSRSLKVLGLEVAYETTDDATDGGMSRVVAKWNLGRSIFNVALWYNEWFEDLPGTRFWYGFQGSEPAMKNLQRHMAASNLSDIPPKFIKYDYAAGWHLYPSSRISGFSCERDGRFHYIGCYHISNDKSEAGVVRAASAFIGRIIEAIEPPEAADIKALESSGLKATERKALIAARLGQGRFRRDLEEVWAGRCALTGCATREALRASHIKPWKVASDKERLSAHNGLLLRATIDALFDKGLISFGDDGKILIGQTLAPADRELLKLDGMQLSQRPSTEQCGFLRYHREELLH